MKILGISASQRKWGNTDILIQHVLRGAEAQGAETTFLRLTISIFGSAEDASPVY